jgi:hypothetical protein
VFAGREVARALGKMAIKAEECTSDTSDFTEKEHATLQEWVDKFDGKYPRVGKVRGKGGGWGGACETAVDGALGAGEGVGCEPAVHTLAATGHSGGEFDPG